MRNQKTKKEATKAMSVTQQPHESPSADLLKKHSEFADVIVANYGKKIVQMLENGSIDFDPDGLKEVVRGEKLSYDDYIDAQINALGKTHSDFQMCFYNFPLGFKGCVEKTSNGHICFQKIFIEGMYGDGYCFDGKEQHVWMDLKGFEDLKAGDCVSFFAEPYRYLKTGDGKQIDFGLRNPEGVKKIEKYELPSDDELIDQELDMMLCDTCFLSDSCNRTVCTNIKWRQEAKKSMKDLLKKTDNE